MRFNERGPGVQSPTAEAQMFPYVRGARTPRVACVACVVCGTTGFPGGRWQETHRRGHAPCLDCGRQLTLRLDGTPRIHARCPKAD